MRARLLLQVEGIEPGSWRGPVEVYEFSATPPESERVRFWTYPQPLVGPLSLLLNAALTTEARALSDAIKADKVDTDETASCMMGETAGTEED